MMRVSLTSLALAIAPYSHAMQAPIAEPGPSQSDSGGVGLLQMPTARMAREGELSANYMDNDQYRRWSLSLQPFSWLETTLRYTDVRTRRYSTNPDFSGDQSYKDKGFDFKVRLYEESAWLPMASLGVRDLMGTGLFDGEYLVASKRWGPFDATLGVGWGYLGGRGNLTNPFCHWRDGWCEREEIDAGRGGKFELDNLFHGPAALFGGIEYQTPWAPLRLKLEYEGNNYRNEFAGRVSQSSALNLGAVYRWQEYLDSHLSFQRGNTLMWGLTLRANLHDLHQGHLDEPRPSYQPDVVPDTLDAVVWPALAEGLRDNAGWKAPSLYADNVSVTLLGQQQKYRELEETQQRSALLAANLLPESVRELRLVEQQRGLAVQTSVIDLGSVRAAAVPQVLGQEREMEVQTWAPAPVQGTLRHQQAPDRFDYWFDPSLTQSFGGPESFYMYQIGINANGEWRLSSQDWLQGTLYVNLLDNYDRFNFTAPPPDGEALPRVRTWIREYVDSSNLLLNNLQLTHMQPLAEGWSGQLYGGYLEMMYAGIGGELLYRPYGKGWALGLDANWVRQRDWNNTLHMADYDVATGHLTGYWSLPFLPGVTARVAVGRYLAKDVGATLDLSKRFDSGVVVGAYATRTDVSSEEYGEGSFSKGIYLTIPFDLMMIRPTTARGSVGWVPLTRDGGQRLNRRHSLYDVTANLPY